MRNSSSYSVFSCRQINIYMCSSAGHRVAVPIKDRFRITSFELSKKQWQSARCAASFTLVHNSNPAVFSPQHFQAYEFAAQQKI